MKNSKLLFYAVVMVLLTVFPSCAADEEGFQLDDENNGTITDDENTNTDEENLCGNKTVDPGEECDSYLTKCVDIDSALYTGGNALCNDDCTLDVSQCVKVEETPDYNVDQPDNEVPDEGDTSDVTSGFSNNSDCQCSVDRNDVCTKSDYDAWNGAPVPAAQNSNVLRLCIGGVWAWAPFSMTGSSAECVDTMCLPGEARQFLQAEANGFCVCLNKCATQTDDADGQSCGDGRFCIKTSDVNGSDVFVCGGHE